MARTARRTGQTAPAAQAGQALFADFLPYLITRLAWQLNCDLVLKLKREGINLTRWRILAVLAMGDGVTVNAITDRAMLQQSALSRALISMQREGYVRRVPRRADARYVEVWLTPRGRALFDSLNVIVRRRQERLLRNFTPAERAAAFGLMRSLSRNLSEPDRPSH
ncbi:MAG: MarR family transcriptional regulator [Proteobacteria bacterium]|nr:MarR family transcriptional regulator [Pseudomonadota bacterium]